MTSPTGSLSEAIREVAKSMRDLRSSRLVEGTLLLLIRDSIKGRDRPTLKQIKLVLEAAENLERNHLK